MFRGRHEHNVDAKGRLALPSVFRRLLAEQGAEHLVVTTHISDPCLVAYPPSEWEAFEKRLWERLQSLADKDDWLSQPYDDSVSPDPSDPHFSLSFGGEAFFVVGLPGVAVAIFLRLTVKEPVRGWSEGRESDTAPPPPFLEVVRFLWSRRSFRHLALAGSLQALVIYAIGN